MLVQTDIFANRSDTLLQFAPYQYVPFIVVTCKPIFLYLRSLIKCYIYVSSLTRRPKMTCHSLSPRENVLATTHTCTKIYTYRLERQTENRWSRCEPNLRQMLTKRWIEGLEAKLFYTPAYAALARCYSSTLFGWY